jgi:hypothetical protein
MPPADHANASRASVNRNVGASGFYHVYPDASESPNLIDDGPDQGRELAPRRITIMGAVAEGATALLVVRRTDGVDVPIPIPWLAVGKPMEIAALQLLPHTITGVIRSADGDDDPAIALSGTPDETRDFTITITDPGDGVDPSTIVFDWEATGSGSEGATGASPSVLGVEALGGTGVVVTFEVGDYTDNSTFEFSAFVTTAQNVMVQW